MSAKIIQGDCLDVLRTLPDQSVNCCVTSPPYYGLRDYGVAGQIGLEASPLEFVEKMVNVFREVRRVLRDDGTLWLNLGDSYAGSWGAQGRPQGDGEMQGRSVASARQIGAHPRFGTGTGTRGAEMGMKPKDLMGMPWRVAFALQADGWYLRQDIIWAKPNPMPESVRDRCTKSHEYLFLLSKCERYYYDFDVMQEPSSDGTHARLPGNVRPAKGAQAYLDGADEHRTKAGLYDFVERQRAKYKTPDGWDTSKGEGGHGSFHKDGREAGHIGYVRKLGAKGNAADVAENRSGAGARMGRGAGWRDDPANTPATRNKRSVWTVATQPFKEAHFATFPPALIEPCILAGCPVGGTVLDPFGGAGTTGLVADRFQRNAILIELNPEYAAMAEKRIHADAGMFAEVTA